MLSRREIEVAAHLALELPNRQIADELSMSASTIERHVANILAKLGVHSRSRAARWAINQGVLSASPGKPNTAP